MAGKIGGTGARKGGPGPMQEPGLKGGNPNPNTIPGAQEYNKVQQPGTAKTPPVK